MTKEQQELYDKLFERCGEKVETKEIRINRTLYNPECAYNSGRLIAYDEWAADTLAQLEKAIEAVKIYRLGIYERFNALQGAKVKNVVKLKRERNYYNNKVFYYIIFLNRFEDGHEEQVDVKKYPGTERNKAIKDFEAFARNNPHYIAIKDIERGKWEK